MVFDRPKKPKKPNPGNPGYPAPTARPNSPVQRPLRSTISGENSGGSGGGNIPPNIPSPWLDAENQPNPDTSASFVEYLRWMRSPDSEYKDATKLQLLQIAEERASYSTRLQQLTERTKLIAKDVFQVKCTWRFRVGGHRGPESILLPAFDALGMPYIPSSSLRGVARCQAIREFMAQKGLQWKDAEKLIAPYFGSLDTDNPSDRGGKVVFLDAYPLPNQGGILAMDMANNIWTWDGNKLKYAPNPNPFFCLKEPIFLIGLRLATGCQDTNILEKVKQWLITGLQAGLGSQVNSGYGEIIPAGKVQSKGEFFRVEFTLQGQLIHGGQKFKNAYQPYQKDRDGHLRTDRQGKFKTDTVPDAEVRPIAFKSMLRYWFRAFALGVLAVDDVKELEAKLFGAINPIQKSGWVSFRISQARLKQKEPRASRDGQNDSHGIQEGILILSYSSESSISQHNSIKELFKNLTWLMFHLGGVGQGARRPCYSRQNRLNAPWWRGSTLIPDSEESFWSLPETPQQFQKLFQQRLKDFYQVLQKLGVTFNYRFLNNISPVTSNQWTEAVDTNCRIIVCSGKEDFEKVYALATLHSPQLKIKDRQGQDNYDGNLCGQVGREVKPSPVWISDLDDYQVVTIFGANIDPRKNYINELKTSKNMKEYFQIFPLPL